MNDNPLDDSQLEAISGGITFNCMPNAHGEFEIIGGDQYWVGRTFSKTAKNEILQDIKKYGKPMHPDWYRHF